MNKKRVAQMFIIISIIFIATLCGIYGYRLVHYYKLEHPKEAQERIFATTLTDMSNIVASGDGLYKEEQGYYYRGMVKNNYVMYSGILWRIVGLDQNNNMTMVSEDPLTSMVFGYKTNTFRDSYVYQWLNDSFYEQLFDHEQYLVDTGYCVDVIKDSSDVHCNNRETSKVGMMSVYEYLKASGSKGYLNNGKTFWTVNVSENNKVWFMNQKGLISNDSVSGNSYYSYGVRPTITVKGNTKIKSGSGSLEDPYQFTSNKSMVLKEQSIGSYIMYSDQIWRIIKIDDLGIKIALNGFLKIDGKEVEQPFSDGSNLYNIKSAKNIGYYLNSTYFKSLQNREYLVEYPWKISYYNSDSKYQYTDHAHTIQTEVGLLQVSDLFVNDFYGYALMNPINEDDGMVLTVLEDGRLYADTVTAELKIRPVVVLKRNLKIESGSGTEKEPFILGG